MSEGCAATRPATQPSHVVVVELDGNDFEPDGHLIRPAATVRKILDEANAQHNCTAGFIDK